MKTKELKKKKHKSSDEAGEPLGGEANGTPNGIHHGDVKAKRHKIDDEVYVEELARLQIELVKLQEWIKHKGLKVVVLFEGRDAAGKGGVIKRITESLNPRICRVVALGTPTEREKKQLVLPALRGPFAVGRRNGPVRPQLVQPRRRRARDGLLHRRGIPGVSAELSRIRADADPFRHHPDQVLVLGQRRRAGARVSRAGWTIRRAVGSSVRWTSSRVPSGSSTRMAKDAMFAHTDTKQAPGAWSRPTTRSARG